MKIIFFGSPEISRLCLQTILSAGHQVELIVTQPDRPSGRGRRLAQSPVKTFAVEQDIPVSQPQRIRKDLTTLQKLKQIKPELNVVVAYGQIIPAEIIYLPEYNSINLHFSFLPEYRGASPVQWAILNGETETGITIFELNEKMDEGPILSQKAIIIHSDENAPQLESRLGKVGAKLLVETISQIHKIKPVPQDHTRSTYAPLIRKEDGRIAWDKEASFIERQMRAFHPWPSVYSFLKGIRIKLIKGKLTDKTCSHSGAGSIVAIKKAGIEICCGDQRVFLIEELQPENKKPMSAYAFSLGSGIEPGNRFT